MVTHADHSPEGDRPWVSTDGRFLLKQVGIFRRTVANVHRLGSRAALCPTGLICQTMIYPVPFKTCRMGGGISYRQMASSNASRKQPPIGMYQCSACSMVLADPASRSDGVVARPSRAAGAVCKGVRCMGSVAECGSGAPMVFAAVGRFDRGESLECLPFAARNTWLIRTSSLLLRTRRRSKR